jgi:hypothetical protein
LCRDALVHLVDPQARPGIEAALFTKHSRHDCCSRLAVQGTNQSSRRRCTNATDIHFSCKARTVHCCGRALPTEYARPAIIMYTYNASQCRRCLVSTASAAATWISYPFRGRASR